jgi:hypothetical protein
MRHELSPLAEAEIGTLESEGIRLSASDILRINALAHRVEKPEVRLALSRGVPVAVGGTHLWPLTLAGSDWFQTVGGEVQGTKRQTLALAYALAKGREPLPYDPREAEEAIVKWGKSLRCRDAELIEAIKQVLAQDETPDTGEEPQHVSAGDISAMLAAMTRTDPAIWEYQCSLSYVVGMLDAIIAQNAAEGKSTKHDPKIKAERALGLAVHRIRERHLKAMKSHG